MTTSAGDNSLSSTTTLGYDATGNLVTVDGPLAGTADTTTFRYNADRQQVGAISADPDGAGPLKRRASRITYNADGLPTVSETGTVNGTSDADWSAFVSLQQATATYDANDRKLTDTTTAGGATWSVAQYSYDAVGRLECAAQRLNSAAWGTLPASACTLGPAGSFGNDRISRTVYDAVGRTSQVLTAYGTPEQTSESESYTANGQVASVTDGQNNLTSYAYDGFDRLVKTRYPVPTPGALASSTTDYEQLYYDANGNVTNRRLRDGQQLNYAYDHLNRRIYDDNPGTNVAEVDVSYSYDLLGRLLNASDGNGWFVAYEYDALGRATRQYSNVSSNGLQYDLAGRRTRQTWGDGFYVTYDYDTLGEMTAVREYGATSGVGVLASYGYDDLGRRTSLARGNGTATFYGYNPASQLTSLSHSLPGTAYGVTTTFTYTPSGQLASSTRDNDAYAWTGAVSVDRNYATNGLNQYTASGSVVPTYDARGNLTSAGGQVYNYNTRNQLYSSSNVYLVYRGPGGLLGQILAGGTGTNIDNVGPDLVTEFNSSTGALNRRYVYGASTDEPLVWYEGSGTSDRRWLAADERGSVVAVTGSAGNVLAINSYDEYGIPGANNLGRFQYTGQKWLPELGLYDYKARMYSPTLGRFLQSDPIGYGDGLNFYNYVGSDPVNASDPTGTSCTNTPNPVQIVPGDIVVTGICPRAFPLAGAGFVYDQREVDRTRTIANYGKSANPNFQLQQKTQTPTPCQRAFLKGQLASRGLPTDQIDQLTFVSGLDGNANAATRVAFPNAAAVTQGATVYVQPSRFNEVANFRSPVGFEEAYHTGQFAQWGAGNFYGSYGVMSIGASILGLGARDGNLIEQFAEGASRVMYRNYQGAGCR
ncbi:MAG: RHS repeat-associated core domain-containing protein [Sphingomonas sp.]